MPPVPSEKRGASWYVSGIIRTCFTLQRGSIYGMSDWMFTPTNKPDSPPIGQEGSSRAESMYRVHPVKSRDNMSPYRVHSRVGFNQQRHESKIDA